MTSAAVVPRRGTRPRDRKHLIERTAAQLFGDHGYSTVSMSDIADAVNVRASALYRHTSGKAALLLSATLAGLAPLVASVQPSSDPVDGHPLGSTIDAAIRERGSARLWVREYRHLDENGRRRVEHDVAALVDGVAARIAPSSTAEVPDALQRRARAIVMLLASISFHPIELTRGRLVSLLKGMTRAVLDVEMPDVTMDVEPAEPVPPRDRRDELLARATALFADRGYAEVSVEEITAAAGLATGTFYSHFASKHEVLAAAITEGEKILGDGADLPDPDESPHVAAGRLVGRYVRAVGLRPDVTTILVNDAFELDESDRLRATRVVDDVVDRWAEQVRAAVGCTRAEARVRAHAALWLIHGLTLWQAAPGGRIGDAAVQRVAVSALLA